MSPTDHDVEILRQEIQAAMFGAGRAFIIGNVELLGVLDALVDARSALSDALDALERGDVEVAIAELEGV